MSDSEVRGAWSLLNRSSPFNLKISHHLTSVFIVYFFCVSDSEVRGAWFLLNRSSPFNLKISHHLTSVFRFYLVYAFRVL